MYHAVALEGMPNGADPHYSILRDDFLSHLELIRAQGKLAISVRDVLARHRQDEECTVLTFDDGHISNYEVVFPLLISHHGTADFFVNPGNVGQRYYATWSDLREMSEAGMSIQSHGYTHRYFDELENEEIRQELMQSKQEIEDKIGQAVTLFAPPGGRFNRRVSRIALDCGYQALCISRAGLWRNNARVVPRLAVLASTPVNLVGSWIQGRESEIGKQVAYYWAKYFMKRLLGNSVYDRMRSHLLKSAGRKVS